MTYKGCICAAVVCTCVSFAGFYGKVKTVKAEPGTMYAWGMDGTASMTAGSSSPVAVFAGGFGNAKIVNTLKIDQPDVEKIPANKFYFLKLAEDKSNKS